MHLIICVIAHQNAGHVLETKGLSPHPYIILQARFGKLIRSGYLQPALRHDADAITRAIAQLRKDLRSGGKDEGPKAA
jgi:hypothetical protein